MISSIPACGIRAQGRGRRHHHAGDAVAALAGAGLVEGALHCGEPALAAPSPSTVSIVRPLRLRNRHEAALHQLAVDEDRAGAAFAGTAALLGPGEVQLVAQEVEQPHGRAAALRPVRPLTVISRSSSGMSCLPSVRDRAEVAPPARRTRVLDLPPRRRSRAPPRGGNPGASATARGRRQIGGRSRSTARLIGLPRRHRLDLGEPHRDRPDAAKRQANVLEPAPRSIDLDQRGGANDGDHQRPPMPDLLEGPPYPSASRRTRSPSRSRLPEPRLAGPDDELAPAASCACCDPSRHSAAQFRSHGIHARAPAGSPSAAGEALTMLPPSVACRRIWSSANQTAQ